MTQQPLHRRVHFIGIGGISMSALAEILLARGIEVSGSDRADSPIIARLRDKGASIALEQKAENIKNPDLVVYTAAIAPDNPELMEARARGIETLERADFLGQYMKSYQKPVSVSGTHGKTTTTSMLSCVLLDAGMDPTVLVGGELAQIGGNLHIGNTEHLIFEGCEYVDSFLKFNPYAALILNIEEDHLDYFSGIEQIKQSFHKFMELIPAEGFVVLNADDPNVMEAAKGITCKRITYGDAGDYRAANVVFGPDGCASFQVVKDGQVLADVTLSVTGSHNVSNALAVFAAATQLGAAPRQIAEGIATFGGAKRRFEYKGTVNGAAVYDDYAHHPTEIKATLCAAKKLAHSRIRCVFQPHTYSRTKALMDDFAQALSMADEVIITDIYAAREKNTVGVHASDLAKKISGATYTADFETIAQKLRETAREGDIILTMGAGTITNLSQLLVE